MTSEDDSFDQGCLTDSYLEEAVKNSIVQIFRTGFTLNYTQPWQIVGRSSSLGTGFAIEVNGSKYIITNAHVVRNALSLQVQRYGMSEKYPAFAKAIGYEVDIALVEVPHQHFWENMTTMPLDLDVLPHPLDHVYAAGFPHGGDNISFTRGVVSRIAVVPYCEGAYTNLAIQVDAAINPGNSGGPALNAEAQVVGISFSLMSGTQGMAYIIPMPLVRLFLLSVEKHRTWPGIPELGAETRSVSNPFMRRYLGLALQEDTNEIGTAPIRGDGVLISKLESFGSAASSLRQGDVLLKINGHDIAGDGSVILRGNERVPFWTMLHTKPVGEAMEVVVWRDKQELTVSMELKPAPRLVPLAQHLSPRSFFIFGGIVFAPLSGALMRDSGSGAFPELSDLFANGQLKTIDDQVVVISDILDHEINRGYGNARFQQVITVDGTPITNLTQLAHLVFKGDGQFVTFGLASSGSVVLGREDAQRYDPIILDTLSIATSMSKDISDALPGAITTKSASGKHNRICMGCAA